MAPIASGLGATHRLRYQAPEAVLAGPRGGRMADYGHDADWITRWVIKKSYGIRNPSVDVIRRYRYWHAVSRSPGGFAASGPWEYWLSREIPPDVVVPERSSLPGADASGAAILVVLRRARELLRGQLSSGPKPGAQIEAAAEVLDIPPRSLIAAADALGVRTQRGHATGSRRESPFFLQVS
jgi:hypothetical protein